MTTSRREFLASAAAGTLPRQAPYFGLHSFIEANPKAVFIRRTKVPQKMDSARKLQEGLQLAREIFVPKTEGGVPITHKILLKPNITSVRSRRPDVDNWGTGTDPDFYEGLILGLKELGLKRFHFAEANLYYGWHYRGFMDIHQRHGVRSNEPEQRFDTKRKNPDVVWSTVPVRLNTGRSEGRVSRESRSAQARTNVASSKAAGDRASAARKASSSVRAVSATSGLP